MPLKLLFVIDNLSTGGAQRQMVNLALGLTQRGHQVEFFCYAAGDLLAKPIYEAYIPIHWHIKRSRFSLEVIMALRDLIKRGNFNIVLSFLTTPNVYAILACRLLYRHRIPVIVSERRGNLSQGEKQIKRYSRLLYRLATHLVTNSHHQRIDLMNNYPWLKHKISTIYNGYNLGDFRPPHHEPDNHPLQILTIAHVSPYKNGLCLIEALNILRQRYALFPKVDWIGQLVMVGKQLEYLETMKQAIKVHELEMQWQWLNQRTDIVPQLHQHDVLVHPSFGEGLPNVVCEALACARPVIVSDVLDHNRLVQDGESGYLFDHRDPEDLAEKIQMFIKLTPEQRNTMGQVGRKFAEANLSVERLTDDYEHLFFERLA